MAIDIHRDTTVRDLLTAYPAAFDVLASHGMCQSCKDDPPPVPIHHFAMKHCGGEVDRLIEEVKAVVASG